MTAEEVPKEKTPTVGEKAKSPTLTTTLSVLLNKSVGNSDYGR